MPDGGDDAEEELGESAERLGGIAGRFGEKGETTETSETPGSGETTEPHPDAQSDTDTASTEMTETTETIETAKTSTTSETTEASATPEPGDDEFKLRDHWNGRTIYLPDELVTDLDVRYSELNAQWQQEHGEKLPKNGQFYAAVLRAGLEETSVAAQLGLDDE